MVAGSGNFLKDSLPLQDEDYKWHFQTYLKHIKKMFSSDGDGNRILGETAYGWLLSLGRVLRALIYCNIWIIAQNMKLTFKVGYNSIQIVHV